MVFNENEKLIDEQEEITGVNTINFKELTWMSTSLLCSEAYQTTNAKAYVFCVLCVGEKGDDPIVTWKSKIQWHSELQCEPGHFTDRIIFMSMFNDVVWDAKGNKERCEYNYRQLRFMLANSLAVIGLSWSLDLKRNGTERTLTKPDGSWNQSPENKLLNFSGSSHPIFRASCALERGELRSKEERRHFNGSHENIELLLCTVISANQLSVYGAIADLCNEVPKDLRDPGKLAST